MALRGRIAIVTPKVNDCTVVYDSICDNQDTDAMDELASKLSSELRCPVLAILIHDDDVFWYRLYLNGQLTDEYNSSPDYFDFGSNDEPAEPSGGDAEKLCSAFGTGNQQEIENILRKPVAAEEDGYVFETERHSDLVHALSLPTFAIGKAYASFERGEYPKGLSAAQMMRPV
jgi:hypothetical protein